MSAFVVVMLGLLVIMGIAAVWLTVRGLRRYNKNPWAAEAAGGGGTYDGGSGAAGCAGGASCGGGSSCGGGCGGGGGD
jgi:hypothetical protein